MRPGRDGFWIHRALAQLGIRNRVVDSASIEVNRRARRMKTDRLDALKLVMMLVRVCSGETRVWTEVQVPSVEAEAARHRSRERTGLIQERTRLRNQISSWLATWGSCVSMSARRQPQWWTQAQDWQGRALPHSVQDRIARAAARMTLLAEQIEGLETAQRMERQAAPADSALGRLVRLKGVSTTSAAVLLEEGLVWREFQNRRQIGGLLGFAPVKYDSGESSRDQGISHAECAAAIGEHPARVELGALAAAECADAVVSIALRPAETRAPDRHRCACAQTPHRLVAVGNGGGRAGGRDRGTGSGVRSIRRGQCHARGAYGLWRVVASDRQREGTAAHASGSRLHCLRSRAPGARSDRRRRWVADPRRSPDAACRRGRTLTRHHASADGIIRRPPARAALSVGSLLGVGYARTPGEQT
jgi:transposase